MASTPIELQDVRPSSPLSMENSQSLLSTTQDHKPSKGSLRWNLLPWNLEILSWIMSLGFFIGITVALGAFRGRALPDLPFGLNPNAIIQVLATFGEVFLMVPVTSALGQMKWLRALQVRPVDEFRAMDEASRGAWGSFLLLGRGKGGIIASFGAFVTIITLAIGTFVQQTLKYDTIYLNSTSAAIPIAKYMNGTGAAHLDGTGEELSGIDAEMQSAAYLGLFSPLHTEFNSSAECNTGNCTWDSYHTLAICNSCADLTSRVTMTKIQIGNNNDTSSYTTDHYSLPNGAYLIPVQDEVGNAPLIAMVLNITTSMDPVQPIVLGESWQPIPSIAFSENSSALLSVFAIGLSPGSVPAVPDDSRLHSYNSMTGPGYGPPVAFECLLHYCVREMRADFRNGTLHESLVSTWTDSEYQYRDPQQVASPLIVLQPPNSMDEFLVDALASGSTAQWVSSLITGNASVSTNEGIAPLLSTSVVPSSGTVQPFLTAMNNSTTGFPDMMDNLARSFSHGLRTIPYQPPPAQGIAVSNTVRATVRWAWLALPFSMLFASLVLLIAVMVETRRKGLVPWSNSILAALFHGIDKRSKGHQARETRSAMEDEARTLLVEFQPNKDGGRLMVTDPV